MALLPQMDNTNLYRENQVAFRGYNHNLHVGEQEFYDTSNITLGHFPVLSPRSPRGRVRAFAKFNGLHDKDGLIWADGTGLYHNGRLVGQVADSPKQFVTMGARVLIWPDKLMYDTEAGSLAPLGASVTLTGASFALSRVDGDLYGAAPSGDTPPASPANGAYWIDTSGDEHALKVYSSAMGSWNTVGTTYVKISHAGLANVFSQYDGITIAGVDNEQFTRAGDDFAVISTGYGWVVVAGIIDAGFTVAGQVTITRRVPDMDYIVESGNRIWGCSSQHHEIYACKLGDPTNWYCYLGLSTDSYAATVGSDGPFTGAIAHQGDVLFFKERCMHRITGVRPSNYQITESGIRGVRAGAEKSLCLVNESLYYLSTGGVVRNDGALPTGIGEALGTGRRFGGAVAGAMDDRYYISMRDGDGVWGLYVYDERGGLWLREDGTQAQAIVRSGDELYIVDGDGVLLSEYGSLSAAYVDADAALEGPVAWLAETGDMLMDSADKGYIGRIQLRLEVEKGAWVEVAVQHDSDGVWYARDRIYATRKRAVALQAIPLRCDHFRLRLTGQGGCKLYSLAKVMEGGSEL